MWCAICPKEIQNHNTNLVVPLKVKVYISLFTGQFYIELKTFLLIPSKNCMGGSRRPSRFVCLSSLVNQLKMLIWNEFLIPDEMLVTFTSQSWFAYNTYAVATLKFIALFHNLSSFPSLFWLHLQRPVGRIRNGCIVISWYLTEVE